MLIGKFVTDNKWQIHKATDIMFFPTMYPSNRNSWISTKEFECQLKEFDAKNVTKYKISSICRHVCCDSPWHPLMCNVNMHDSQIVLELQPLDLGIIKYFKLCWCITPSLTYLKLRVGVAKQRAQHILKGLRLHQDRARLQITPANHTVYKILLSSWPSTKFLMFLSIQCGNTNFRFEKNK